MAQQTPVPPPPRHAGDGRDPKSTGQLMKEVTEDVSTLVRMEIQLAKQELGDALTAKLKGMASLAIVGALGLFALVFVLLAVRDGLADLMWTWVADLATAGLLLAVGVAGALFAKRQLSKPLSTELTKQSLKEDVEMAKSLGKRP